MLIKELRLTIPFLQQSKSISLLFPCGVCLGRRHQLFSKQSSIQVKSSASSFSSSNSSGIVSTNLVGTCLKSRSLIRLYGADTLQFLQGLTTNNINHLSIQPSIYSLLLNQQGRVLYDVILYNTKQSLPYTQPDQLQLLDTLLECDSSIQPQLIKHLTLYKLKKKVEVKDIKGQYNIWSVFDPQIVQGAIRLQYKDAILSEVCTGSDSVLPNTGTVATECPYKLELVDQNLKPTSDPRIGYLGWRVISSSQGILESRGQPIKIESTETEYKKSLYALGIGEGVGDLPPGNCFPLESNGDILHGINFHKGCYIGQELTARTHHTGVVRKRLMPFTLPSGTTFPSGTDKSKLEIINPTTKRPVGKVRNIIDNIGLALIRIEDALAAPELKLGEQTVTIKRPFWWPKSESATQESATQ